MDGRPFDEAELRASLEDAVHRQLMTDVPYGVLLSGRDVYLNVAGGLRISEPAADLAVAAALLGLGACGVPFVPLI